MGQDRFEDGRTRISAPTGTRLASIAPISIHGLFGNGCVEALSIVIEDGEFVPGENVCRGICFNASPDIADGTFEVCVDVRVESSFCVSGNVDGPLIRQLTYAIDACLTIDAHGAVVRR